ncbi:MAG TPA: hypothetical protein PKZ76_16985 [Xanthomonadaceae bacterium]|nr:hypothetical protein [Xanthomonadaceae bacterium]
MLTKDSHGSQPLAQVVQGEASRKWIGRWRSFVAVAPPKDSHGSQPLAQVVQGEASRKWIGRWRSFVAVAPLLAAGSLSATQWNEPFDREVIEAAETFIRAEVIDDYPPRLRVLEVLAGEQVTGTLRVTGFGVPGYYGDHSLRQMGWKRGSKLYAFLARAKSGKNWTIATPTAGIGHYYTDDVILGSVRISCAGALFKEEVYRTVHAALFRALHGEADAKAELERFARYELGREPEIFGGEGDPMNALPFFRQHAALETLAVFPELGEGVDLAPFLRARDMHAQISAVRALAARDGSTPLLIDVLADESAELVPKMVAARALRGRQLDAEQRKRLMNLQGSASDEAVDLCGGSIMDPRLPFEYSEVSVRRAIADALGAELE